MTTARLGPVEYAVIAFPGNRFSGAIAAELTRLIGEASSTLST